MSIASNQQRIFLRLLARLRPHWRRDAALPARIHSLLAANRAFGSRDRRLYRELIYTTLRHLPWIEPWLDAQPDEAIRRVAWLAADSSATKTFRATFAVGEPPSGDKTELLPSWFRSHCPEIFSGDELEAQLLRAPLWLRLQTDETGARDVLSEFESQGWEWRRSPLLEGAVEVLAEADVTTSRAWRDGRIEVQDLGSQLILASIGIEPGGTWLDACAGAGGKTLQLSRLLGSTGTVDAHDVRPEALIELRARAARTGLVCHLMNDKPPPPPPALSTSSCHPLDDKNATPRTSEDENFGRIRIVGRALEREREYDGVLVDAPCSGSGTWRRAPHLKWITTAAQIQTAAAKQRELLHQFSRNVRAGGRLVYATCSLSRRENEEVVGWFLAEHPEFHPAPFARDFGAALRGSGLTFFPAKHNTDGFFVASLRRQR